MKVNVYVGKDKSNPLPYEVCVRSITEQLSIDVFPVNKYTIQEYNRIPDKFESTDFSFARFFVPYLNGFKGVSIFVDGDFLFLSNISDLIQLFDPKYALMCCQHEYNPTNKFKMDGKLQSSFPRKNWSSLMIFNNAHPKMRTLSPETINCQSGAFLHRFKFLEDGEIGSIPFQWNWLVGHYHEPLDGSPKALHYTEGGPWLEDYKNSEYSDIFHTYKRRFNLN